MSDLDRRDEFLIAMYNQLMNDINRHIVVVWQSVATLVAAVAAFGLVKEKIISMELACALIIATCVWLIAHVYDASDWYNRNLVIIANIERQFLRSSDQRHIHAYFGLHRPAGSMISHLQIQLGLGLAVAVLILLMHYFTVLEPLFDQPGSVDKIYYLPYCVGVAGIVLWRLIAHRSRKKYEEFLRNSPGVPIDTSGVKFEVGHGRNEYDERNAKPPGN